VPIAVLIVRTGVRVEPYGIIVVKIGRALYETRARRRTSYGYANRVRIELSTNTITTIYSHAVSATASSNIRRGRVVHLHFHQGTRHVTAETDDQGALNALQWKEQPSVGYTIRVVARR
jgi:hypothetical protein